MFEPIATRDEYECVKTYYPLLSNFEQCTDDDNAGFVKLTDDDIEKLRVISANLQHSVLEFCLRVWAIA